MTDEDFEKAKSEKDKTIHILHFTDLNSIRPIYYDKTYHAVPEAGGDKAFELLRKAMKDENKVAIAKTVMGTKEKLLTLIPTDDGILIEPFRRIKTLNKTDCPFSEIPKGNENAIWVTPELVCTVKYMMKTESGGMRQPVFKGLRDDKLPEECVENII